MINNKKILLFGGTGSLGYEIVKRYIGNNIIYNYSRDECKHWKMKLDFNNNTNLNFIIGDVINSHKIEETLLRVKPNIIIGEELYSKKSLLEWVISNKGSTIEGYTTHYWNGVTCLTLSNIISKIVNENLYWKGVKHIASPEMVSKFQLCEYINQIYDLNLKIVPIEKEYKNLTLKSDNIFKTDSIYDQIDTQKKYNIC